MRHLDHHRPRRRLPRLAVWAVAVTTVGQLALATDYPPPPGPYSPPAAGTAPPSAMTQRSDGPPEPVRRRSPPPTFRDPVTHPLAPPPAAPSGERSADRQRPAPVREPLGQTYAHPFVRPAPPTTPAWVQERRATAWRPAPPAANPALSAPPVFRAYRPPPAQPAAPARPTPSQRAPAVAAPPAERRSPRTQRVAPPQRPEWTQPYGSYTRADSGRQDPRFRPPDLQGTP